MSLRRKLNTITFCSALAILNVVPGLAQTVTDIHYFQPADGLTPYGTPYFDSNGTMYGTTSVSGPGSGTVFSINSSGSFTVLHAFGGGTGLVQNPSGQNVPDGSRPHCGVIPGPDGYLYGTTTTPGTVYKMKPDGTGYLQLAVLPNGASTEAGLATANDGNLYGSTPQYIYKVTPAGNITVIHNFQSATEGSYCYSQLIQAKDGFLYGTCNIGGSANMGTVWKMSLDGNLTVLHSFTNPSPPFGNDDGQNPIGGLVQAGDGNLYGTTTTGGANGQGTLYSISGGTFAVLTTFPAANFGHTIYCNPFLGSDGNLYITNDVGNALFEIALPSGAVTVIHSFHADQFGGDIYSGVAEGPDGNLYGACRFTDPNGYGAMYSIALGLPATPALTTLSPSTYPVGSSTFTLTLTGSHFVSGDTVTWAGSPLTTTYVSSTTLTAVVPASDLAVAGSFNVAVNNPTNSRTSNALPFTVSVPNPVITGIAPGRGFVGSPSLIITVTGSGFVNGCQVCVDGSPRPTTFASRTTLQAFVLTADMAVNTTRNITVKSQGIESNSNSFRVQGTVLGATYASTRNPDGTLTIVVSYVNIGNASALATTLKTATLANVATTTTLPINSGTIPSGGVATVTLKFPASAAVSGSAPSISLAGNITGGSFTMKQGITVP